MSSVAGGSFRRGGAQASANCLQRRSRTVPAPAPPRRIDTCSMRQDTSPKSSRSVTYLGLLPLRLVRSQTEVVAHEIPWMKPPRAHTTASSDSDERGRPSAGPWASWVRQFMNKCLCSATVKPDRTEDDRIFDSGNRYRNPSIVHLEKRGPRGVRGKRGQYPRGCAQTTAFRPGSPERGSRWES
jgi:hypothetical protein